MLLYLKVVDLDLQGNNFGERVSSRAFSGVSRHLLSLNLAWANITRLPGKLLRGMVALRNLTLAENRIRRLASYSFQDLRSLERLSLAGNPLVELQPDVFRYQTNLYALDLGYCSLTVLPWNVFNGNLFETSIVQCDPHDILAFKLSETVLFAYLQTGTVSDIG